MTTVAEADVQSRLAELLERSANGETFEVVKDGRPVVHIGPAGVEGSTASVKKDPARAKAAAESLIAMAGFGGRMTAQELKAMIHGNKIEI